MHTVLVYRYLEIYTILFYKTIENFIYYDFSDNSKYNFAQSNIVVYFPLYYRCNVLKKLRILELSQNKKTCPKVKTSFFVLIGICYFVNIPF
jgi:hypothetical protein